MEQATATGIQMMGLPDTKNLEPRKVPPSRMPQSEFGFLSERWNGCKTIKDLNGNRKKYRGGLLVDVVDIHSCKKIGRMELSQAILKFS